MDHKFVRQLGNPRWLIAGAMLLWAAALHAAEVAAELRQETIGVNEVAHIDVTVSGGRPDDSPKAPDVPGLELLGSFSSSRMEMTNFHVTHTQTFTFQYAPTKVGSITIPAIPVFVDGQRVMTKPLTLTVEGGNSQQGRSWQGRSRQPAQQPRHAQIPPAPGHSKDEEPDDSRPHPGDRIAFAEWVFPKTTAYIGEAIPVELRLYVANRLRWNLNQYPTITGDGFMMQKLPAKPKSSVVTRDGQQWDVVIFRTAVTPVKSGKITIEPAELLPVIQVPQTPRRRPVPRGFQDFFDDPFFNDAFGGSVVKQISIKTEPVELEIKPLPEEGKPASFAGAVGRFSLSVAAQPLRVEGGDPVTLTMKVGGMGNFERVTAPHVADDDGWRSYPPSAKFQADDEEVGITGEKTFEMALIPKSADGHEKRDLPAVEFAFFDPTQERYVVLHGDRKEIVVSGGDKAKDREESEAKSAVAQATPPASSSQAPEQKAGDIRFIRLDTGAWHFASGPLWTNPLFLGANGLALLAFVGWCGIRRRQTRPAPTEQMQWKAARAAAMRRMRSATGAEFYDAAVEALQLHAALYGAGAPASLEAAQIAVLPIVKGSALGDAGDIVHEIFATRDRLRYAGSEGDGQGAGRIEVLRQQISQIVKA